MASYRSMNSFPPPRSHPSNFEVHLQKLKSCEIPILALLDLVELYGSVQQQQLNRSPTAAVEESLSRSVDLLDACIAIGDILRMLKEKIQALQSSLRRKGSDYSGLRNDVASYLGFRKRTNKLAAKTLRNLGKIGTGTSSTTAFGELTGVTVTILKGILVVLLSGPVSKPGGGWAFVSKVIMNLKPAGSNNNNNNNNNKIHGDVINEVGSVDFALRYIMGEIKKSNYDVTTFDVKSVQRELRNLETMVEGLEEGTERLFRQLLRFRVTLLNILTPN